MEHWLYDGFQFGEPYTFTYNTYNPILGVDVNGRRSRLSTASDGIAYPLSFKFNVATKT